MFCQYKDVFGKPREGAHAYRLFDFAVVDVLLTVVVGYVLSRILRKPPALVIGALFVAGIALHRLFCVRTTLDRLLFS
jgi:nicotinamidase-related amidase